jgi:hypothetical protein
VALWAGSLTALPAGTRVAFLYTPRPAAVVLDLAIQAAGLASLPLSLDAHPPEGPCVQAAPAGEPLLGLEGVEPIPLPAWDDAPAEARSSSFEGRPVGGVLVQGAAGWEERPQDDLRTAAGQLEREARQAGPPREGREVLVLCRPLAEPAERAMLAWATHVRAAVLLDPVPTSCVATTAWARPTVFHGTVDEIAALRRFEEGSVPRLWKRRHRLPFGRLRLILVRGEGEMGAEDRAFWEEKGVRVSRVDLDS